jgi:aspartyl-tRNA(Asn)/glutamyl-tRNA(Gln) amidotransferase subunit A
MMNLTELTISEAARLIKKQALSPVELTEAYLARIDELDSRLNCFITLTTEQAMEQARQAEAAIQRGGYLGPLHGIPLALKDLYETAGVRTTAGSTFLADNVPLNDAVAVQKLKAAGMVNLGKLNMHEIALGVTNNNPHYGACHNPWQVDLTPGGSSGGSGAALAAGLCPGSLGTDTGGSIRIPASLCGIVGLKPTYGRVSTRGVITLSWNLDHAGPMARSVSDAALLLQVIAGYDPQDPYSADVPVEDYINQLGAGVRSWRVGLAGGDFFRRADQQVLAAVDQAAQAFAELGAQISEVEIPNGYEAALANGMMTVSDAAAFYREQLESQPEGFGKDVLERLRSGAGMSSTEYILARRTQTLMRRQFQDFFEEYDLLLTPTTPITAPALEGPDAIEQARRLTRFTAPFNLTGLPALSLPCGFSMEGLPVGLQIIGPAWAEARLLRAGHAYEGATDWHLRRALD